jgi:hypothetical protein
VGREIGMRMPFTLRQSQFRTKKEYCFALATASPPAQNIGRFKSTYEGLALDGSNGSS